MVTSQRIQAGASATWPTFALEWRSTVLRAALCWTRVAMRKVWIEAALNGQWSRSRQPGIPDTVDAIVSEGIACADAGACIVHVHAYDGGGPQISARTSAHGGRADHKAQ